MWYIIVIAACLLPFSAAAEGQQGKDGYTKQVDNIAKVYEASLNVINDGRQEKYVEELDRCYNAMVADIARGGNGHVCDEKEKFVEGKIPTLEDVQATEAAVPRPIAKSK